MSLTRKEKCWAALVYALKELGFPRYFESGLKGFDEWAGSERGIAFLRAAQGPSDVWDDMNKIKEALGLPEARQVQL